MAVSNIKALFQSDVKTVWNIVTSLEKYQWRSDLSKIEILNERQFIEYTKDGFATTFTITVSLVFALIGNLQGKFFLTQFRFFVILFSAEKVLIILSVNNS